jgi:exocyst complex component 3
MQEISDILDRMAPVKLKLKELRDENLKHRQYAAAIENLKHIFNVPETIERTRKLIQDNELLLAHKKWVCVTSETILFVHSLMDLERARDDLMLEVHRLQTKSEYDKNLLKSYFAGVEIVAAELAKQVFYIISRCLEAVRGADPGPQQVVTALRIIEREERLA